MLERVEQHELRLPEQPGSTTPKDVDLAISGSPCHSTTASGVTSPQSVGSPPSSDNEEPTIFPAKARSRVWCTDTDISAYVTHGGERELKPWAPDDGSLSGDEQELERAAHFKNKQCSNRDWDQFQVNAELFGVVSSFKNDLSQYTTVLDVSKVPQELRAKAERLAHEIESGRKNLVANDDDGNGSDGDEDEEARWSAVPRDNGSFQTKAALDNRSSLKSGTANCPRNESRGIDFVREVPCEQATRHGTYMHIDGVGIVDEHSARSMLGTIGHDPMPTNPTGFLCTSPADITPPMAWVATDYLLPGTVVMIEGLLKAPAFNGCYGIVQSYDAESGRYNIRLQAGPDANQLAKVKIENLRWVIPEMQGYMYQ